MVSDIETQLVLIDGKKNSIKCEMAQDRRIQSEMAEDLRIQCEMAEDWRID